MISSWKAALFLAALSIWACSPQAVQPTTTGALCRTEAHFSRRGGAADSVIQTLNQARSKIQVAMYGLTYAGSLMRLLATKMRGVDVALKTDKLEDAGGHDFKAGAGRNPGGGVRAIKIAPSQIRSDR